MTYNASPVGIKRKHYEDFDDESTSLRLKRARTVPTEDMMVLGLVPMMTITPLPLKYAPNQELVNQVKRIITSGTKTQKQVAKECNLSQTKMSQFMNLSPRVKGWESVEAKVIAWLRSSSRRQRASHLLESDYSVPQSCVIALEEPKTEDYSATVCLQNPGNPWQLKDTSAINRLSQRDLQNTNAYYATEYNMGQYSSDEVSNTSSDRSGVEISAEDSSPHPKPNSAAYIPEDTSRLYTGMESRSRRNGIQYHGFYNDYAWDNFSIVHALDSSI